MSRFRKVFFVILMTGMTAWAQDAATKPLLLSFEQTNAYLQTESAACTDCGMQGLAGPGTTVHYPTTNVCISVYNDGSYSYDRVEDKGGKPKVKTFKGTLAAPELAKLQSILDDSGFKKLVSPAPDLEPPYDARAVKEGEVVTATVMHQEGPQILTLLKRHYTTNSAGGMEKYVTNWDKLEKPLKPFLSFMKDMDKKGQSEGKVGESSCQMTTSPF